MKFPTKKNLLTQKKRQKNKVSQAKKVLKNTAFGNVWQKIGEEDKKEKPVTCITLIGENFSGKVEHSKRQKKFILSSYQKKKDEFCQEVFQDGREDSRTT